MEAISSCVTPDEAVLIANTRTGRAMFLSSFSPRSATHLAVGVLGKTDTARISNAFKARGNVDAVAHQVAIALLDHVAQMDADAELDATLRRKTRVALDHAILHLDCAANGIDDASELYEDAVTRPLDDAAVMHGDGGIDQIASQRSEAGKCPLLVGPGKLAESDHIRRKKAASFRVSAMAVPSPHARLARLLIGLYRLWVQHLIQHILGVASPRSAITHPAPID